MSEDPNPAEMDVTERRGRLGRNLSVVWLVPLFALVVSLAVAWRAYESRGSLVEISFDNAAGLVPGQSVLKFRQVTVGKVERVGFTADLSRVLVSVRVQKDVAARIDSKAQFWIVRPQIGFGGVTGLDTVLSGVFIEGRWGPGYSGPPPARFTGLEQAPIENAKGSGTWVTLAAPDARSLIEGAPVLLRGIKVGQLRNIRLDDSGKEVLADAYVEAPYDRQLTSASVFWNASGFSISLGQSGLKLDVQSLSSLVQGGVEFGTFVTGGQPVEARHVFTLNRDEQSARDAILADTGVAKAKMSIFVDGSVRGLKRGDPVNFRGLPVGEVSDLTIQVTEAPNETRIVRQRADFTLDPERMGLGRGAGQQETVDFLTAEVAQGLRARVAAAGPFGGKLEIDLIDPPNPAPARLDAKANPYPVLPTVPPDIPDISARAQSTLARIDALPIEKLMDSAIALLNSANGLLGQSDTQNVPKQISGLIGEIRAVVGSPDLQAAPEALNKALNRADAFFEALKTAGTVDSIVSAMKSASDAAQAVTDSAKGVPGLVDTYTQLGQKANRLPLDELAANADALVSSLHELTSSEQAKRLPQSLNDTLASLDAMLGELQKGGAAENLNGAIASAEDAAKSVQGAADRLPDLTRRLSESVDRIDAVLATYGSNSSFNSETLATLRKLRDAAESIAAVGRMLQRNPQALILGR